MTIAMASTIFNTVAFDSSAVPCNAFAKIIFEFSDISGRVFIHARLVHQVSIIVSVRFFGRFTNDGAVHDAETLKAIRENADGLRSTICRH